MKYDYLSAIPADFTKKFIKRPLVEIEIFGPTRSHKELALVDSGADRSLFNIEVAKLLEIDLKKAHQDIVTGIYGSGKVLVTEIEIKIKHLEGKIKIPVSFIDSPCVGVLLGQEGFFDTHRIKFEKDHDTFEIVPIKKK